MKKSRNFQTSFLLIVLLTLVFSACKKDHFDIPEQEMDATATSWDYNVASAAARSECPAGDIILTTQAEVDSFAQAYPNCTNLNGSLKIMPASENDINSLNALSNVVGIAGDLDVDGTGTFNNLTGLHNITSIAGSLRINENQALFSLTGLEGLESVGDNIFLLGCGFTTLEGVDWENLSFDGTIEIKDNPDLTSVMGGAGGMPTGMFNSIRISNNPLLTDISFFENITTIQDDLIINNNDALVNVNVFEELESIGGNLKITNNEKVNSVQAGLGGGTPTGGIYVGGDYIVSNNAAMTSFEVDEQFGSITIDGNLEILNNAQLNSVTGGDHGVAIQFGNLSIINNDNLSNVVIVDQLPSEVTLTITGNDELAVCAIESICEFIDDGGQVIISNNAQGCKSLNEVKAECAATMECGTFKPRSWATGIKRHSAKIKWDAVNEATLYKVRYRKKNSNHPWTVKQTTNTVKTLHNLLANTTYEWQIRCQCSGGWADWGQERYFKTKP